MQDDLQDGLNLFAVVINTQ